MITLNWTDIEINGIRFPVGSNRRIRQDLEIIDNGDLRRTVNGTLRNTTRSQARKYSTKITADDIASAAFDGFWRGDIVTISCITRLRQTVPDIATVTTEREAGGGVQGIKSDGSKVTGTILDSETIQFPEPVVIASYRPIMDFMISDIAKNFDENVAEESWTLSGREV